MTAIELKKEIRALNKKVNQLLARVKQNGDTSESASQEQFEKSFNCSYNA
jgi:hypothetical protein